MSAAAATPQGPFLDDLTSLLAGAYRRMSEFLAAARIKCNPLLKGHRITPVAAADEDANRSGDDDLDP